MAKSKDKGYLSKTEIVDKVKSMASVKKKKKIYDDFLDREINKLVKTEKAKEKKIKLKELNEKFK